MVAIALGSFGCFGVVLWPEHSHRAVARILEIATDSLGFCRACGALGQCLFSVADTEYDLSQFF